MPSWGDSSEAMLRLKLPRDNFNLAVMNNLYWSSGKKKKYTTTTERKSFGELFWPQRKTFQVGGGYKNPMKTRKTISTTEIFPLWPPFFFSAKKSSALEQGGVCFLFPRVDVSWGRGKGTRNGHEASTKALRGYWASNQKALKVSYRGSNRRRTNVQQLTCNIDLPFSFYIIFYSLLFSLS